MNKTIIFKQKGGFFNKLRLINNVEYLIHKNYNVYILDKEDDEFNGKFFDYYISKPRFGKPYKIIHDLNEINDIDDNLIYLNEFKWTSLELHKIENLKIFDKYKQKYIFINTGGILGRGMWTQMKFNENYSKIKLEDSDFKIIQDLKKYDNITVLRCSPPEWDKFMYLNDKISYLEIHKSYTATHKWRNLYRLDLNSNMVEFIKTLDNNILLLDYVNSDIKKVINDNNLNYIELYPNNNRNNSGINAVIKKYLVLENIISEKKNSNIHTIYGSVSSSIVDGLRTATLNNDNDSIGFTNISFNKIYPDPINIKIEGIDNDKFLNLKSNISHFNFISNPDIEYEIYLSNNIEKNYDNVFNCISLFNELLNEFSYYIALELYLETNIQVNENIIKLSNDWQHPIATEYYTYLQLRYININKYKYVAMPWATIIDNWTHNKKINKKEFPITSIFEDDLNRIKEMKLDNGVTVIQHILYERMIPLFKEIGIKYVFASHCLKETEYEGIKIFPYFLYNYTYNLDCSINRKKLLCNSIYGVCTNKDRNDLINKLNKSKYINIKTNNSWFFQDLVYNFQIKNTYIDTSSFYNENREYFKFINESSFQICLAGSGKNTIRLFECINLKIVPVIDFDIHINCSIFNLDNYVIKINMNDLIEHLKLHDLDTFYVNNEKFEDLIEKKKKNIEKDFNNIKTLDLYSNYIKEKLNIT